MNDDISGQIEELRRRTQRIRYQFLITELDVCFSAVDFARTQLEMGDLELAGKESVDAAKGIETISRFLPELDDADDRSSIQVKLDELRGVLDAFQRELQQ